MRLDSEQKTFYEALSELELTLNNLKWDIKDAARRTRERIQNTLNVLRCHFNRHQWSAKYFPEVTRDAYDNYCSIKGCSAKRNVAAYELIDLDIRLTQVYFDRTAQRWIAKERNA